MTGEQKSGWAQLLVVLGFLALLAALVLAPVKAHSETIDINDCYGWAGCTGLATGGIFTFSNLPLHTTKNKVDPAPALIGGTIFNIEGQRVLRGEALFNFSKMSDTEKLQDLFGIVSTIWTASGCLLAWEF